MMLNRYWKATINILYDLTLDPVCYCNSNPTPTTRKKDTLNPILIIPIPNNILAGGAG